MIPSARPPFSVMIVDDSTAARAFLRQIVESDSRLQVMATANDAQSAARKMKTALPDVMLLDIDLPGINGLSFLRKIMSQRPLPVVICSSHAVEGSELVQIARAAGAHDVVEKPIMADAADYERARRRICAALRAGAAGPLARQSETGAPHVPTKHSPDVIMPMPAVLRPAPATEPIVCLGASTGGTEALRQVLTALPAEAPAIVIVQHMPEGFTTAFARRMDSLSKIQVIEAEGGERLRQGCAVIAPGNRHLILRRIGSEYRTDLVDGPPISRHRPSVDLLFRSVAIAAGDNALGILMTGMGDDGALSLGDMRKAGAKTAVQDEQSCVVFGMPRAALELGSASQMLPVEAIAAFIMSFAQRHRQGLLR